MSDIIIKSETDGSHDSLRALTTLLQEVKKEEHPELFSEDETQSDNNKGEALPESFFDDLYRDEIEAGPDEATTDADIQKLQEIIAKKKRILNEGVEDAVENRQTEFRSRSPDGHGRKRKDHQTNNQDKQSGNAAKRSRPTIDTSEDVSPTLEAETDHNISTQQPPIPDNDRSAPTEEATDAELELENLLKSEDYNSDDESSNSNQKMQFSNTMQPMYGFPNSMTMMPTMYSSATNQMMPNMAPGGYPMMCNMGFPPGFYPPNMMNMPMMGYGLPQMNVSANENEVECLPVVSVAELPKITFKKIKLEKTVDKTVAPAEDPKRKIIDACTLLLEKLEFPEQTGKFVYTSTVTKHNNTPASNSILQKITNVSYNFQSIGPKQNLQDWGLKGIPSANVEIAKKISISADKYFSKISENSNTIARKLVKQEVAKADKTRNHEEMEVEELTLSTFFKNSMTQTDALVCRECVARKRKVGHEIATQATVFTGSIGTQTSTQVRFNDHLTEGMSDNQLKAMYEFSMLIREPPKNTSVELLRLREQLIHMYNLSQRQHKGPVPFVNASIHQPVQHTVRDPRIDSRSNLDSRNFTHTDAQNQITQQPPVPTFGQNMPNYSQHGMNAGQQIQSIQQHLEHAPRQDASNYSHQMPNQQIPSYQFPGRGRPQERPKQIPSVQMRNGPLGLGHDAEFPDQHLAEFPGQGGRKNYGRGGLRR